MPRRAYIADLAKLTEDVTIPGIFDIKSGADDGECEFYITPKVGGPKFKLTAMVSDLGDYPSSHQYMLFAADGATEEVVQMLNRVPNITGKDLATMLDCVAGSFALQDESGDTYMTDSQTDELQSENNEEDEDDDDFDLDFDGGRTTAMRTVYSTVPKVPSTTTFQERIRSDLRTAKAAGFKTGYQGELLEGGPCFVSLSCRVAKLGISEEALQAWKLTRSQYLVIILAFPHGYRSLDKLCSYNQTSARREIEMRVGVSNTYKPSLQEAHQAFRHLTNDEEK
ncbi:hypothetical protein LTS18_012285, partial [Coniosporium uncinatum]